MFVDHKVRTEEQPHIHSTPEKQSSFESHQEPKMLSYAPKKRREHKNPDSYKKDYSFNKAYVWGFACPA
jgi:hypothetical protein